MIIGHVLAACVPLVSCTDVGYASPCASPTPTLKWDAVAGDIAGYKVYEVIAGVPFLRATLARQAWYDDLGSFCGYTQQGVDLDYPVQRAIDTQLQAVDWCVTAYTASGVESVVCSAPITVCMPETWAPGKVYR